MHRLFFPQTNIIRQGNLIEASYKANRYSITPSAAESRNEIQK